MAVSGTGRWVVLGAGGFIGKQLLAARPNAVGVTRREVDLAVEGAGEKLAQILREGDTVFFLSAITPDKGRDAGTFLKNCRMAVELASAVTRIRLDRLVYLSSDAVFRENLPPITELTPPCPDTLYGTMHLAREQICAAAVGSQNIPLLIVRPCAVYGPGDTHGSYGPNRFLESAHRESLIRLFGEGEDRRPHLHIRDLVYFLCQLVDRRAEGVFHVIPPESVRFRELAAWICDRFPGVRVEKVPAAGPPTAKHYSAEKITAFLREAKFTGLPEGLFL